MLYKFNELGEIIFVLIRVPITCIPEYIYSIQEQGLESLEYRNTAKNVTND